MMNYECACTRCLNIYEASEITQILVGASIYRICKNCFPSWKRQWQAGALEQPRDKLFWTPEREATLQLLDADCDSHIVTEPGLLKEARRRGLI